MEIDIFKWLLVITNFYLLTNLLVIVVNHYTFQYNMKSWGSIFHFLSLVWLIIRGAFWISTLLPHMHWTVFNFYLLYWMPTPFEFAAFLVLPLYFAQIVYGDRWKDLWEYVRPLYGVVIALLCAVQLLWCVVAALPKEAHCTGYMSDDAPAPPPSFCFRTEVNSAVFRAITAVCFFFLAGVQYVFGEEVVTLPAQRYDQYLTTPRSTITLVNFVLVASFLSRASYQLLSLCGIYTLPDVDIGGQAGDEDEGSAEAGGGGGGLDVFQCAVFLFWTYIPTLLIVTYLTPPAPSSSKGLGGAGARAYAAGTAEEEEEEEEEEDEEVWRQIPSLLPPAQHKHSHPYHARGAGGVASVRTPLLSRSLSASYNSHGAAMPQVLEGAGAGEAMSLQDSSIDWSKYMGARIPPPPAPAYSQSLSYSTPSPLYGSMRKSLHAHSRPYHAHNNNNTHAPAQNNNAPLTSHRTPPDPHTTHPPPTTHHSAAYASHFLQPAGHPSHPAAHYANPLIPNPPITHHYQYQHPLPTIYSPAPDALVPPSQQAYEDQVEPRPSVLQVPCPTRAPGPARSVMMLGSPSPSSGSGGMYGGVGEGPGDSEGVLWGSCGAGGEGLVRQAHPSPNKHASSSYPHPL